MVWLFKEGLGSKPVLINSLPLESMGESDDDDDMTAIFPLHQNMAAMSFLSAATHCAPSSSFHGCLPVGRRELLFPSGANLLIPKSSNILDNASNLFTNLLSGGSLGSMLTAEGAVSDLFGKPLFLSLVHGDKNREKERQEPSPSGSDRPGTLPARRPCFTTANPSPGNAKDVDETNEIPETVASTDLLLKTLADHSSSYPPGISPLGL